MNPFRDPKVRGCGRGDIRFMLESGDMGGKCADINALYVGLARAVGIPARHVYGLRIAKSQEGYKSIGLASDKATKGQHCRAEIYLKDYGWVPVDPADVRKVALEEPPGNLTLNDQAVAKARKQLFGFWEMNWMAYNYAHDVALPGSSGKPWCTSCIRRPRRRKAAWIRSTQTISSTRSRRESWGRRGRVPSRPEIFRLPAVVIGARKADPLRTKVREG